MRPILPLLGLLSLLAAAPAAAYDPEEERNNYARVDDRFRHEQTDPGYQRQVVEDSAAGLADILVRDVEEGGERFSGSLCGAGVLICAADPRMRDWPGGEPVPVTWINRNGAHVEGHVWATDAARRDGTPLPGVVIQTGSVQAPENWYLWAAQVLAANGYVVLTFDVQGQGRSDLFGSHDSHAFDGVPAQDVHHFVEDLEDALDFFHSTPAAPYDPGTAHARARQAERLQDGAVDGHNPLHALFDGERLGIAGHSLGGRAVSYVQGTDERVDAVVGWDNLQSAETEPALAIVPRVPALGMSGDYYIVPQPHTSDPDPTAKSAAFRAWREKGLDAMQVNLRGGTHFEWSYSPSPLIPATLRGIDVAAWYTTAWFDRWVKGDLAATGRLLTDRWLADPVDEQIDPEGGGNMYSFYSRSPVHLTSDGVVCEDLRDGCAGALAPDGDEQPYSYREDRG